MNILVTGGAGYIGGVVAAELLQRDHGVVILDDLSRGHRAAVPSGAHLAVGCISNRSLLDQLLKDHSIGAVMHFAAHSQAGESMQRPEMYFRNNVASTLTLLESMLDHGVKDFVFSSSAAVYGDPERSPIQEDDRLLPTSPYGESKLMVEKMLEWFHRRHGLRFASLRYFNAAGADGTRGEDHTPESHIIPVVLLAALGKVSEIVIHGQDYATPDGTCVRDYVHVSDLASAHVLALGALPSAHRLIFNVATERSYSVRDVVETATRVSGRKIPFRYGPRRAGDPERLVASAQKIRRELGWEPRYPELESIIRTAWEWHLSHPNGYGN